MMTSGILINIRITLDKRNEDVNDLFRYSYAYDHSIKIKYYISKIRKLVPVIIRNPVL